MARTDSRGLPLLTTSDRAAERYRKGVDLMLSTWPGAAEALDEAIAADPDFALAHAARARQHAMRSEPALAKARIATAAELVARRGTERERSHVEILSLVLNGRTAEAIDGVSAHADNWPRDVVILSLPLGAFGLLAFSGRADHDQARVDLCERHASHFASDDWWFLTYRGWSHAENGNVAHGRDLTQRGFDLRPQNANAAHALSHAMYEGGANDEADRLIQAWLPTYDRSGILHGHIAWHAALAALEHGNTERALALYAEHVQPSVSTGNAVNVVSDTASFLWRLQAYGYQVPEGLWQAAATYATPSFPSAGFAFADVHMALLAAATGDKEELERRVSALMGLIEAGKLPAGPVVPAICRAALAFAEEDYAGCVRILEPVASEAVRIGGSGAQRELVEDMLLLALMRSGEAARAGTLLDRRLHRRPSPRDKAWHGLLAA
ncbi:tetratricopeptide repeat protein [Roseomonas sp. KE2513]|uniref:tetratricopeptide repeat protein n=1 Tax=Roseomonas sp. KE2513 TaxID=2479202 RepID=UPI0018DFD8FA|nr:tetratricopeptide repeat protein [Roseomonas sp. KE2513]MBI0539488.1 tetratricopeptide repeat protein [Roseomonas sp. KE2513]